jgi:hypothetical protein
LIYISYGMDVIMLHDVSLITTLSYNSRDQISFFARFFIFIHIASDSFLLLLLVLSIATSDPAVNRHPG